MLPKETSVRQLKMLRKLSKGTDIGDITTKDRLNKNIPNMQSIANPVDTGIESWEEFSKKDSKLQTIAFKSKLVNKPIVKKNKNDTMNEKVQKDILKFENFDKKVNEKIEEETILEEDNNIIEKFKLFNEKNKFEDFFNKTLKKTGKSLSEMNEKEKKEFFNEIDSNWKAQNETEYNQFFKKELEKTDKSLSEMNETEIKKFFNKIDSLWKSEKEKNVNEKQVTDEKNRKNESEKVENFDSYIMNEKKKSDKAKEKKEEQPEYEMLGKEKEPKSNPNFGIGAVKADEIKKITDLNIIDPPTPKERPILNAGQFIDNGVVNGQINRIEGKDVFVESAEEPGIINKHTINDILKIKEEKKEEE